MIFFNVCENPRFLSVLSFLGFAINVIKIMIPIIVILLVSIDFGRAVVGLDEDMKKTLNRIGTRLLFMVLIYLVPFIISLVLSIIGETGIVKNVDAFDRCMANINDDYIREAYRAESSRRKIEMEKIQRAISEDKSSYEKKLLEEAERKNRLREEETTEDETVIEYESDITKGVVFDENDLTKISNLSAQEFQRAVQNVNGAKNMVPYAADLIAAERKYGVNVFFLAGLQAHESGYYTSAIFRKCNNVGGMVAGNSPNKCSVNRRFRSFSSVKESIDFQANLLKKYYLTPGGDYYHGTSIKSVQTSYCPEASCSSWYSGVSSLAKTFYKGVRK